MQGSVIIPRFKFLYISIKGENYKLREKKRFHLQINHKLSFTKNRYFICNENSISPQPPINYNQTYPADYNRVIKRKRKKFAK